MDKVFESVETLQERNKTLTLSVEGFQQKALAALRDNLIQKAEIKDGITFITEEVTVEDAEQMRQLTYLCKAHLESFVFVCGANLNGKANLSIMFSQDLVEKYQLHAGNLIREVAKEIQGGGGGQAFYASAGGRKVEGITTAIQKAKELIDSKINVVGE